jgi:hypothetical protein
MTQPTLFDGPTYDPALDEARLSRQLGRVWNALNEGGWWTLEELANVCGGSEAGVSARIRDLRKPRFGGYKIERLRGRDRKHPQGGLFFYRMVTKSRMYLQTETGARILPDNHEERQRVLKGIGD